MKRGLITVGIVILIITGIDISKGIWHAITAEPETICTKSHTETNWVYGYGLNPFNGKFEFSYHPETKTTCLKYEHNPKYRGSGK